MTCRALLKFISLLLYLGSLAAAGPKRAQHKDLVDAFTCVLYPVCVSGSQLCYTVKWVCELTLDSTRNE